MLENLISIPTSFWVGAGVTGAIVLLFLLKRGSGVKAAGEEFDEIIDREEEDAAEHHDSASEHVRRARERLRNASNNGN